MGYALTDSISELLDQPVKDNHINAMLHCPFHEDRTPSFSIHLEDGVWHCFSCGDAGTLKRLYRELGKEVDLDVRLYQAKKRAQHSEPDHHNFAPVANRCTSDAKGTNGKGYIRDIRVFLRSRGISETTARHYGLGWSRERGAIAFPYSDVEGRVSGIKYRYPDGFKASETGSHYGLFGVSDVIGKSTVIICEGESDTLAMHSRLHGPESELRSETPLRDNGMELAHTGVCGTSGASVSDTQWSRFSVHLFFARRVFLAYDADEAGDKCAETAMQVLGDKCRRARPTRGKDVSEHFLAGGTLGEMGVQ